MKHIRQRAFASVLLLVAAPLAWSQSSDSDNGDSETLDEVVVTSHPLAGNGLAVATNVIAGDELQRALTESLGTTVANTPGVHASSFGNAATRPVIHGLGGARVRVMQDSIDTLDVSVSSPDHAVMVDPFVAERIEILKGAGTLLYGTGAIGGVVDVHTGRIPHTLPDDALSGSADLRGTDNGDLTNLALRLNGAAGRFAWHIDGFDRSADEYDIPGFAESAALRALEEAEGGEEEEEGEEEAFGTLPGSQLESQGGAVGLSWIGDRVFVGAAISAVDSEYGLPGGHAHEEGEEGAEEEEEEGNPILILDQVRFDAEFGLSDLPGAFDSFSVRVGVNDYEHQEVEPSGEVATVYANEAYEARFELGHSDLGGWTGQLGAQISDREFSAVGEEAFVPPVDTSDWGLFWVLERDIGNVGLELGARFGQVEHTPVSGGSQDYDSYGYSVGLIRPFDSGLTLALQIDASQRAPVAEELFSDGPHLATQSFEIGDPTLGEESAINVSATVNVRRGPFEFVLTGYHIQFSDYIYEFATGAEEDGLPVFQFAQNDARFTGAEAEAKAYLLEAEDLDLSVRLFGDFVDASFDDGGGNLPRIPPGRLGFGMDLETSGFTVGVDVTRVSSQNSTAANELSTEGYTDLSLYSSYTFDFGESAQAEFFLRGSNLTDSEQRLHTSFIKDFAPLPGRAVTAGVRIDF